MFHSSTLTILFRPSPNDSIPWAREEKSHRHDSQVVFNILSKKAKKTSAHHLKLVKSPPALLISTPLSLSATSKHSSLIIYLDDILMLGEDPARLNTKLGLLQELFQALGLAINIITTNRTCNHHKHSNYSTYWKLRWWPPLLLTLCPA